MGPAAGCDIALVLLGPAERVCCPQGKAPGWGLNLPSGAPVGLMASLSSERLLKLPLEGLHEFFQYSISKPWTLDDDTVIKRLQATMTELQKKKYGLLPPGGLSRGPLLIPLPGQ